MNAVYQKLFAVQQGIKAPKGQYNSFGKYKYRSCEDILEAAKPILGANKAVILLTDEAKNVMDRCYIVATATFVDTESGASISVSSQAREELEKKGMDASQVTGAASSYARKYALNGLLCIDDAKDSDATNNGQERKPIICEQCGKPIEAVRGKSGDLIPPERVAEKSRIKYGQNLCLYCATERGTSGS